MLAYTRIAVLGKGDGTLSEKVGGRGEGSIQYQGKGGKIHVWFRYSFEGKRRRLPLGVLDVDTTLRAAREKARDYAEALQEHPDLTGWVDLQKARKLQAEVLERQRIELAERQGSLLELLDDYRADLARQGKESASEVKRIARREIGEAHPEIGRLRACDVEPVHIVAILKPIWDRGAHVLHNRVRAFLHAAFQYGSAAEYDVARSSDRKFGLRANPVALVPRQKDAEKAGTVALTVDQLRTFYTAIGDSRGVGIIISVFLRLCIATGGQRPAQLLRAPWDAYNLDDRYVRIEDRKGRGAMRVHLVPLTDRALSLLEIVRPVTESQPWPFTFTGKAPVNLASLKNAINRFRAEHGEIPAFTARDLRRTCKQFAMRYGVPAQPMNVLQGHELGGLVGKHYANDPEVWLPEKRQAIAAFEIALQQVLGERVE